MGVRFIFLTVMVSVYPVQKLSRKRSRFHCHFCVALRPSHCFSHSPGVENVNSITCFLPPPFDILKSSHQTWFLLSVVKKTVVPSVAKWSPCLDRSNIPSVTRQEVHQVSKDNFSVFGDGFVDCLAGPEQQRFLFTVSHFFFFLNHVLLLIHIIDTRNYSC